MKLRTVWGGLLIAGAALVLTETSVLAAVKPQVVSPSSDQPTSSHSMRDVPAAAVDPSKTDTDNGAGNNCDPGYGRGNQARFPNDDTTAPACASSGAAASRAGAAAASAATSGTNGAHSGAGLTGVGAVAAAVTGAVGSAGQGVEGIALASTGSPVVPLVAGLVLLFAGAFFLLRRAPSVS
jgi:hypothetical protein